MAVTVTAVAKPSGLPPRKNLAIFDVEATADADTTATITHGLGVVPQKVSIEMIAAAARTSLWIETIASRNATQVVLTKGTGAGSGAAGNQIRVYIEVPSTIAA
jgi:DNA/RNA endonuclease YhcR with UshA esterase domain